MNKTLNYSPNFDTKKRKSKDIKFIIFHYTGMKKETNAINKLTNNKSKVSSHYFIKKNGEILNLVPDLYIAWHAGISSWKKTKFLNKYSIGIEISNTGHKYKKESYNRKQISSLLKLSRTLIKKYKIKSEFILGHSDISPDRKKDPGENFPWRYFSKKKIGLWHNINKKIIIKYRHQKIREDEKKLFIKNLYRIGYSKYLTKRKILNFKILTTAFQRRFRQEIVNGVIDKECLVISNNLVKKFN